MMTVISVCTWVCASPFILVSSFSDVKKAVEKKNERRQHNWAPKEAEEKCSILKSELLMEDRLAVDDR